MTDKTKQMLENVYYYARISKCEREKEEKELLSMVLESANNNTHELNHIIFDSLSKAYILDEKDGLFTDTYYTLVDVKKPDKYNSLKTYEVFLKPLTPQSLNDIFNVKDVAFQSIHDSEVNEHKRMIQKWVNCENLHISSTNLRILNVITKYNQEHSDKIMIMIDKDGKNKFFFFNELEFKNFGFNIEQCKNSTTKLTIENHKISRTIEQILDQKAYNNQYITLEDMKPFIKTYQSFVNKEQFVDEYNNMCQSNLDEFEYNIYKSLISSYQVANSYINKEFEFEFKAKIIDNEDSIKAYCDDETINSYECFKVISKDKKVVFIGFDCDNKTVFYPVISRKLFEFLSTLWNINASHEIVFCKDKGYDILKISVDSYMFEQMILNMNSKQK